MNKRLKKKFHKKYLEDVALEISQSSIWRERLFENQYNKRFLITYENTNEVPDYLKLAFLNYKLRYYISKADSCSEKFDKELVIFKIEAVDFRSLIRYSGNNYDVI